MKNINTDSEKKEITTDLLMVFPQKNNPHKVVVDRAGKIIDVYKDIAKTNPGISYWFQIMADFPASWEPIEVENIEQAATYEELFLLVCCQTEDKMLIVYHHNGWTKGKYYHKRNILHNNAPIRVLDRKEAINLLSLPEEEAVNEISNYKKDLQVPPIINNITNSIVAQQGSSVKEAKIEQK